jgi:hypothetical protein
MKGGLSKSKEEGERGKGGKDSTFILQEKGVNFMGKCNDAVVLKMC